MSVRLVRDGVVATGVARGASGTRGGTMCVCVLRRARGGLGGG